MHFKSRTLYVSSTAHYINQLIARILISLSGIIGYAPEVHELMTHHKVSDTYDDQLYYTKLYLDENFRVRRST